MKKMLTIFVIGLFFVSSYIFNTSVFEVYGLINIGDTALTEYHIDNATPNQLSTIYEYLDENQLPLQIVKTPILEDNITLYEIYHTNIDSVTHFTGLSKTIYQYYSINKDEFIDSTGYFYSEISQDSIHEISEVYGIQIDRVYQKSNLSYEMIVKNNLINLIVLLLTTFLVMAGYTISKSRENAIKKMLGYSTSKIMFSKIVEVIKLSSSALFLVLLINNVFYISKGVWSPFYFFSLLFFLVTIAMLIFATLFLTQCFIKNIDIIEVIKNKFFSKKMNIVVKITKITFLIIIAISTTESINHYNALQANSSKIAEYEMFADLYSSYGRSADESEKTRNDGLTIQVADEVKLMYTENYSSAYVMDEGVSELSLAGPSFGISPEELHSSYEYNYAILNENYINKYTDLELPRALSSDVTILMIPIKYKEMEKEISEYYFNIVNDLYNKNIFYDDSLQVKIREIEIHYIDDDYYLKLLSSYQHENETDITLTNPIIIVDDGSFDSTYYYHLISSLKLAYNLDSRADFKSMLEQYNLGDVYFAHTMSEPYQIVVNNNKFLLSQSIVFITMFLITIAFVIYISNYIDIMVNKNKFAIKNLLGYAHTSILRQEIITTLVLLLLGAVLIMLQVQVQIYILLIIFDFILYLCFYKFLLLKKIKEILNGGY